MGSGISVMEEFVDYLLKKGERERWRHRGPPVPSVEREALPRCAPEDGQEDRCS